MQILLRVVPSFANYQVWWPYKTDISFCKKLYVGIKAQNFILGFGLWPRALIGSRTNKQ